MGGVGRVGRAALVAHYRLVQEQEKLLEGKGKGSRQVPSDCWDGRLRAQGVSGAHGRLDLLSEGSQDRLVFKVL